MAGQSEDPAILSSRGYRSSERGEKERKRGD
jgi:hypothetical protein